MLSISQIESKISETYTKANAVKAEAKAKVQAVKNNEAATKALNTAMTKAENLSKEATTLKTELQSVTTKLTDLQKQLKNATTDDAKNKLNKEISKLTAKQTTLFNKLTNQLSEIAGLEKQVSESESSEKEAAIYKLSQQLLSKRLEEEMEQELAKLKTTGTVTDEQVEKMRAVIRAHKTVEITQSEILTSATKAIDKQLTSYIDKQAKELKSKLNIKSYTNQYTNKVDSILKQEKGIYKEYTKIYDKIYDASKSTDSCALTITKSIAENLNNYSGLNSFYSKIDNSINKVFGTNIKTKTLLGPALSKIETNIGNSVAKKLQPAIQKHVKEIQKITTEVVKFQKQIEEAEKKFKETIEKYQNMVNNYIQEQTKALGEKLSKELGQNLLSGINLKI